MNPDELMAVADRVLSMAGAGEELEVVVSHSRDTEVRAYDGEIEAFTSAESAGFGVRVVKDGRQGFAYAGTLDADVVADTVGEARDNATFSTEDEFCGLVVARWRRSAAARCVRRRPRRVGSGTEDRARSRTRAPRARR